MLLGGRLGLETRQQRTLEPGIPATEWMQNVLRTLSYTFKSAENKDNLFNKKLF